MFLRPTLTSLSQFVQDYRQGNLAATRESYYCFLIFKKNSHFLVSDNFLLTDLGGFFALEIEGAQQFSSDKGHLY